MTNEEQAKRFLEFIGENYDKLKKQNKAYCINTRQTFDEDVFSDTYMKIYDTICKKGIEDDTYDGMANYLFKSFKTNIKREKLYARNLKKNENIQDMTTLHEQHLNSLLTEKEKLLQDLKKDFSVLYIFLKAEKYLPNDSLYLFRLKLFNNYTYKELAEKTNLKGIRQKVIEVKQWIMENITKEEIDKAFNKEYGDLVF